MTMTLISTTTVGAGGTATVSVTGIPQTFTDLMVVVSARTDVANTVAQFRVQFNGNNSGTNYLYRWLSGNGSSASSTASGATSLLVAASTIVGGNATANTFSNGQIYIPNYTSTGTKSVSIDSVSETNGVTAQQALMAGSWAGAAGISSIQIFSLDGTILQNSSVSVYGITKGSGGATVS